MTIIASNSYKSYNICDKIFDKEFDGEVESIPESGICNVPMYQVCKFFELTNESDNKYIIISSMGDLGLHYTKDMLNLDHLVRHQHQCDKRHSYAIKTNGMVTNTFSHIPNNIKKWYTVNGNINHPRVVNIPFGISESNTSFVRSFWTDFEQKQDKIYINWTDYTKERQFLKDHAKHFPEYTVDNRYDTHEEFYENLSDHKYVLCPWGNGLDTYRLWETLYVGSIPVVNNGPWCQQWIDLGLPIITVDSFMLHGVPSFGSIDSFCNEHDLTNSQSYNITYLDYWFNKIIESRKLL